jgi:hypothetical protein
VKPRITITHFGEIMECPNCKASVSINLNTGEPNGVLANTELKAERRLAHIYINELKTRKIAKDNVTVKEAKEMLYKWISESLGLDFKIESIAQLFLDETKILITLLKKYRK